MVVSVKVPDHFAVVRAALEAGKHVFCEWPLGANTAEATDLLDLAASQSVRHVIGLQGRRSPIVNYVRDLVAAGYIGELVYAELLVEGVGRGGEITADREWTTDRANGVGTLRIIGGHNLDVLRYIVGELTEVQATVAIRYPVVTVMETGEADSRDLAGCRARPRASRWRRLRVDRHPDRSAQRLRRPPRAAGH